MFYSNILKDNQEHFKIRIKEVLGPEAKVSFAFDDALEVVIFNDSRFVGSVSMSDFPSNCGSIIFHNASFKDTLSEDSVKKVMDFFLEMAYFMGFSQVLYAATENQSKLRTHLKNAGFKSVESVGFRNKRTNNYIDHFFFNFWGN